MAPNPEVVDLLSSDDDEVEAPPNGATKASQAKSNIRSETAVGTKKSPAKRPRPSSSLLDDSSSSSDDDSLLDGYQPRAGVKAKPPAAKKRAASTSLKRAPSTASSSSAASKNKTKPPQRARNTASASKKKSTRTLQAGLVLEEDVVAALSLHQRIQNENEKANTKNKKTETAAAADASCGTRFLREQHERISNGDSPVLFEDEEFGPLASSIDGIHKKSLFGKQQQQQTKTGKAKNKTTDATNDDPTQFFPKCWCKCPAKLCFKVRTDPGKAYFMCGGGGGTVTKTKNGNGATFKPGKAKKCRFFSWAFRSELMSWYRYGQHNQHALVKAPRQQQPRFPSDIAAFSAQDLVQGKVGDCWFLSALAVVAERPDLIQRLFQRETSSGSSTSNTVVNWEQEDQWGMVQVNLFLDGFWTRVCMDNFLPCMLGQVNPKEEEELKRAIEESLNDQTKEDSTKIRNPYAKKQQHSFGNGRRLNDGKVIAASTASDRDPSALSQSNLEIMQETQSFLNEQRQKTNTVLNNNTESSSLQILDRAAESQDLAYSKARRNQLWVPFLEKAYAKVHGSYKAISGGHIAEAFLDLTGAPTLQIQWHRNGAHHNSSIYEPKPLWYKLLQWRAQRLPMGCGTDSSAQGIIGMHAYSILDVREICNVGVEFFQEQLLTGTLGNVSGFTEYDGKVRLLRIRNPHGQGEWKGDFSDKSGKWEELRTSGVSLPRTMANDGTFWIDYDNFLLGYSNIDVVLAFQGNHAKSFATNFPPKKSNDRCVRAFEVSLIDPQPGIETKDHVEVYVMGVQKNRRGAKQGRADRKKSYKVSDMAMLVGEYPLDAKEDDDENFGFSIVHGQMFGFRRNGHYRLVLDRSKCRRMVVMPISFGHPAATDKEFSFAVRFNADAPLMIRELENTPRMNHVLSHFVFQPKPLGHFEETRQGQKKTLWQNANFKVVQIDCLGNGGGTVFVYLCSKTPSAAGQKVEPISVSLEANVRGMSCRTDQGLLDHETIAKGKKFEASWRRYKATFLREQTSRLLMVLYQSGQDTEMGGITCRLGTALGSSSDTPQSGSPKKNMATTTLDQFWSTTLKKNHDDKGYLERGIFHSLPSLDADAFELCGQTYETIDTSAFAGMGPSAMMEDEIQTAMEMSRRQYEKSQNDRDLEEALRRSREEAGGGNTMDAFEDSKPPAVNLADEDTELKRALELSMAASKPAGKQPSETVDLTRPDAAMNRNRKKPATVSSPEIIILCDDDDQEEKKEEETPKKKKRRNKPPSPSKKRAKKRSPKADDRELKRKLAAEAALKRLQGDTDAEEKKRDMESGILWSSIE